MLGWIKLDREVLESKVFANPNDLKIWLWLMLKASTNDRFLTLKTGKGCQTIELKRGQIVFGRNKAETELKIDGSTIYRTLQRFQDEQLIIIKANNQFSIITVLDFINSQSFTETEDFEILEDEQPINKSLSNQRTSNEQPTDNQSTTNGQPTNTVKEGLESKEGLELKKVEESKEVPAPADLFGDGILKTKPNGKKRKPAQEAAPKLEIVLPWETDTFCNSWQIYKNFRKKQHGFEYKSEESEQAGLKQLASLADGLEEKAVKIINQTLVKGWKGLFALKNEDNGNSEFKTVHPNENGTTSTGATIASRIIANNDKYGR